MRYRNALVVIGISLLLFIPFSTISFPKASAQTTLTSTVTQTFNPHGFGIDVGPATFTYTPTTFKWSQGSSSITMNAPAIQVGTLGQCTVFQTPEFPGAYFKNQTMYWWPYVVDLSGQCGGYTGSVAALMTVYVKNTTNYNSKEIIIEGSAVGSGYGGLATALNNMSMPLTFTGNLGICNSGVNKTTGNALCTSIQSGQTLLNWQDFLSHSAYNNKTNTLNFWAPWSCVGNSCSFYFDPLAIDGSAACHNGNSNTCNLSLTTSNSNDIIIVISASTSGGGVGAFSLPSDSAGLTYHNRAQWCSDGWSCASINGFTGVSEDYAVAASTLSSDSINCTQSGNINARISCVAYGISGADTSTIFDSHSGLPCKNDNGGSTSSLLFCTLSTSNANDIIIGSGSASGIVNATAGAGFSFAKCNQLDIDGTACSEYQIVSSTKTSLSVNYTISVNNHWAFIGDAIMQASGGTTAYSHTLSASISLNPTITTVSLSGAETSSISLNPTITTVSLSGAQTKTLTVSPSIIQMLQNNLTRSENLSGSIPTLSLANNLTQTETLSPTIVSMTLSFTTCIFTNMATFFVTITKTGTFTNVTIFKLNGTTTVTYQYTFTNPVTVSLTGTGATTWTTSTTISGTKTYTITFTNLYTLSATSLYTSFTYTTTKTNSYTYTLSQTLRNTTTATVAYTYTLSYTILTTSNIGTDTFTITLTKATTWTTTQNPATTQTTTVTVIGTSTSTSTIPFSTNTNIITLSTVTTRTTTQGVATVTVTVGKTVTSTSTTTYGQPITLSNTATTSVTTTQTGTQTFKVTNTTSATTTETNTGTVTGTASVTYTITANQTNTATFTLPVTGTNTYSKNFTVALTNTTTNTVTNLATQTATFSVGLNGTATFVNTLVATGGTTGQATFTNSCSVPVGGGTILINGASSDQIALGLILGIVLGGTALFRLRRRNNTGIIVE